MRNHQTPSRLSTLVRRSLVGGAGFAAAAPMQSYAMQSCAMQSCAMQSHAMQPAMPSPFGFAGAGWCAAADIAGRADVPAAKLARDAKTSAHPGIRGSAPPV